MSTLQKRFGPGQSKVADKLLRTKSSLTLHQDAASATIKETHQRPSSRFHEGAHRTKVSRVDPTTGKAWIHGESSGAKLTPLGRKVRFRGAVTAGAGGYGGLVYSDNKKRKKSVQKNYVSAFGVVH